jgi:hypothetical protein
VANRIAEVEVRLSNQTKAPIMASHPPFSLADILAIAKIHPFYASDVKYPPDADTIQMVRERLSQGNVETNLTTQAVLWRSTL